MSSSLSLLSSLLLLPRVHRRPRLHGLVDDVDVPLPSFFPKKSFLKRSLLSLLSATKYRIREEKKKISARLKSFCAFSVKVVVAVAVLLSLVFFVFE
jgi:hypothetical protein